MKKIACEYFISGKVQGVWFRASTKEQADRLKVSGWAKNLADGRVQVYLQGEEEAVKQLVDWLNHGPPLAQVSECIGNNVELDNQLEAEFIILS